MRIFGFLRRSFDRSFSENAFNQILWLFGILIVAVVVIACLNKSIESDCISHSNNCCELCEHNNKRNEALCNESTWVVLLNMLTTESLHNAVCSALDDTGQIPDEAKKKIIILFITYIVGLIILTGMLISTITNILKTRSRNYLQGKVYYPFNGHIIILGYDCMVANLIKDLLENKNKYQKGNKWREIVIQTTMDIEKVRQDLLVQIGKSFYKKVHVVKARRDSLKDLKKLCFKRAKEVYILGEKDEMEHDAISMNCLKKIVEICKESKRNDILPCHTLLQYQSTYVLFQRTDYPLYTKEERAENKDLVKFLPFNFQEIWAQKLLVSCKSSHHIDIVYNPLDHCDITKDTNKSVHLVVVGMTNMGIAIAMQAAQIAHYPNFITKKLKSKITFIDIDARMNMEYMVGRYQQLFKRCHYSYESVELESEDRNLIYFSPKKEDDFIDLEWNFIQANVANEKIKQRFVEWSDEDSRSYLTIVVAFNDLPKNMATGLYFPDELYERKIPVYIQQNTIGDAFPLIIKPQTGTDKFKFVNVKPFGMIDDSYEPDDLLIRWAKYINYLCKVLDEKGIPQVYNEEKVERYWDELSVVDKWAKIYCAESIPTRLRSIGIKPENISPSLELTTEQIELLAEVEHNRWNVEKLMMGYRPATEEEKQKIRNNIEVSKPLHKDDFIHFDICPYNQLENDHTGYNVNRYDIAIIKGLPAIVLNTRNKN